MGQAYFNPKSFSFWAIAPEQPACLVLNIAGVRRACAPASLRFITDLQLGCAMSAVAGGGSEA